MPARLRFAPSPTGPLHLGSAVVAVANALAARSLGGEVLLRIDDTDAGRSVEGAEQGILDDLAWLGLELAGAPVRQSERRERHDAAAAQLLATAHAYRCFCPPSDERYGGRCRALPRADAERRHEAGEQNVIRFRVPAVEVVVEDATPRCRPLRRRGDLRTSCSCAAMAGRRSISRPRSTIATSRSRTSCAARITSQLRPPPAAAARARRRGTGVRPLPDHRRADGERLSTRRGAESLASLRERGVPAEAVVAFAAQLACPAQDGAPEAVSFDELAARFSLARLGRGTAHADPAHLAWLGRELLAALPAEELARRLERSCQAERQ